jgi:RNA polymerase sigma-70 factor (ECF subfamily)
MDADAPVPHAAADEADALLTASLADDLDGSFEAVVVAHQDRLYTIALRLLADAGEAEEVAQDALVRAYRALATYDSARIRELRLRGWLTTICLNRCRSRLTRRATRPVRPVALEPLLEQGHEPAAAAERGPSAIVERRVEGETWARRLAGLPVAYRAAVVLRHVDGLSYPEVAAALGRPEGTVKAQVHRGIALLRATLEAEASPELQEMSA